MATLAVGVASGAVLELILLLGIVHCEPGLSPGIPVPLLFKQRLSPYSHHLFESHLTHFRCQTIYNIKLSLKAISCCRSTNQTHLWQPMKHASIKGAPTVHLMGVQTRRIKQSSVCSWGCRHPYEPSLGSCLCMSLLKPCFGTC